MAPEPMPHSEIHQKWREITDDGRADSRVADARHDINVLRTSLRARYNINPEALGLLDALERAVAVQLERDIVIGAFGPRWLWPTED